jgi:hypothetical protein
MKHLAHMPIINLQINGITRLLKYANKMELLG